ncbi:MAG TPA: kelch repeat-containing protein [Acidobacteriaceae bacterium]
MASWQSLHNQPSFAADTMLLLTDGTVMVHELNTAHWHRLTPDSSGGYINGSWSSLASLPDNSGIPTTKGGPTNAPLYFASAVLADGRVFVAGGEYNTGKADADILTAQIYDPLSDTWTAIATPAGWTGIGDAPSCVLADGRLLLGNFNSSATAILDPATLTWKAAGTKNGTTGNTKADSCSEETFNLLPNGNVLTVECSNTPKAEQYIPGSDTWVSAGSTGETLPQACPGFVAEIGPALTLPDGRAFAVGATGATALYTPDPDPAKAGTWTNGPTLTDAQGNTSFPMDVPGVLLPNGKVMVLGAPGPPCNYPSPTTVFLYDPGNNTASVITGPSNADGSPFGARLLLLPNGQVMYSASRKDIEVYTPDSGGQASWKPTITDFPGTLYLGETYRISGTQFNGVSQACSYGDDAQAATNYPIVRLQIGGKSFYLRTFNHSTMAIATGAAIVSTSVYVPGNIPAGRGSVVVIANGIASDPVSVTVSPVRENLDTTNSGWRTSWDVIVAGDFIGNNKQQILLYDRAAGQADVVGFDSNGRSNLDTTNSGWRTSWEMIVPGNFIGNNKQQILLYDRAAGQADVVGFDSNGRTNLDTTNSGWRNSWNVIVAGNFIGNGRQQILLYDRAAGQADIVGFDANGKTNLDTTNSGWRSSWDLIVVGDFIGNGRQQVLLYDRGAGQADVVGFDSNGRANLDTTNSGWRSSWNLIVAGALLGNGKEQIVLYDRAAGQADVVGFDANGNANLDTTNSGWRTSWDPIVAGTLLAGNKQQILLYDRAVGQADLVGFDSHGNTNLDMTNSGWRSSWVAILTGAFIGNGRQQLLLYDRAAGQADVVGFTS